MKNKIFLILENVFEVISVLGIVIQIITIIHSWGFIPKEVPIHFGISGKVDSYGEKKSLLVFPVITVVIFLGLTFAVHHHKLLSTLVDLPETDNEKRSRNLFKTARLFTQLIKLILVWFFTYIEWRVIQIALGNAKNLGFVFIVFLLSLIVIVVIFRISLNGDGIFVVCSKNEKEEE